MVFVCRPDHHLAQRDCVAIVDLADEDLIGFPAEFGPRRLVEDAFAAAGIAAHTVRGGARVPSCGRVATAWAWDHFHARK